MSALDVCITVGFLSLLFIVGSLAARKTHNQVYYLLANRNTKIIPLIATLVMTEFNATTFVSHSAAGYSAGLRALALPSVLFICLMFYAFTVAKKWKEYNGESLAHYFSLRYSKALGFFAAVCFIFVMLGLASTYIKSFTILVGNIFPHYSKLQISAVLVVIIGLISLRGGLKSIISIDTFSFFALLIFFTRYVVVLCVLSTRVVACCNSTLAVTPSIIAQ